MAQEKKRGGCLKWGLIILIVIIAFGACVGAMGGGEDTSTDDTGAEQDAAQETTTEENTEEATEETTQEETTEEVVEEEEANEVVGIGQTLTVDDVDFTVNDWYQTESVGNDILQETPNDAFLVLDVTVTNNQNEAMTVMSDYFQIKVEESTYQPDTVASTTANQANDPNNLGLLAEEINPGSTRNALIVYDVTQDVIDTADKQVQVQSGIWGTQTGLINLE